MRIGHADLGIRAQAALAAEHERRDARQVGLERDRLHVEHQRRVVGEEHRHAARHLEVGRHLARVALGDLDAALDLAHRCEVFVHLAAIRRPERADQRVGALGHDVQDAPALASTNRARGRVQPGIDPAEQPFEHQPRVRLRRHRRGRAAPREAVRVGAAVAGVAVADRARLVAAELDRREPRVAADRVCGDLIDRDAGLDVGARRLARVDARQVTRRGARVVAGAVGQGVRVLLRQARDDQRVLAQRLERLQDSRECELAPAGGRRPRRRASRRWGCR